MSRDAAAVLTALLDPTALTCEAVRVPLLSDEVAREVEERVRAAVEGRHGPGTNRALKPHPTPPALPK